MGYSSREDFVIDFWEGFAVLKDPNDLLCHLDTWQVDFTSVCQSLVFDCLFRFWIITVLYQLIHQCVSHSAAGCGACSKSTAA